MNGGECTGAGVCQCPVGWFGEACDWTGQCERLAVYTADEGEFGDGSGALPYGNMVSCGFYVEPESGVETIELTVEEFAIEGGYDFVYVYDDLQQSNLLLELTGTEAPGTTLKLGASSLYVQFISDSEVDAPGFHFSYKGIRPPAFSEGEYTFTFIGEAVTVDESWRVNRGVFVGSVDAMDPCGGDLTYSFLRPKTAKFFSFGEDGDILIDEVPASGAVYTLTVEACSDYSELCARATVVMVILDVDGCLDDGTCPPSGPVFTPPYRFVFEGRKQAKGSVVGHVQAEDPVYDYAVVRFSTPDKGAELANVYFEIESNGDVVVLKELEKYMEGDTFNLPVVACSVSGCSSKKVKLTVLEAGAGGDGGPPPPGPPP